MFLDCLFYVEWGLFVFFYFNCYGVFLTVRGDLLSDDFFHWVFRFFAGLEGCLFLYLGFLLLLFRLYIGLFYVYFDFTSIVVSVWCGFYRYCSPPGGSHSGTFSFSSFGVAVSLFSHEGYFSWSSGNLPLLDLSQVSMVILC